MRGLTGSEIVILLELKKRPMTFAEIDTFLKESPGEPSKTTRHWVDLLGDKRLLCRSSEASENFCLTEKGDTKAEEFLRIIGNYVPVAVALI